MKVTRKCKKCGVKIITINGKSLEDALMDFRRKISFEQIEELRKKNKVYLSTEEILKARDEGRK